MKFRILIASIMCLLAGEVFGCETGTYFGADTHWRELGFKSTRGRHEMGKRSLGRSLYVGYMLTDKVAFELGSSWVRTRTVGVNSNKSRHVRADVVGFLPVYKNLELLGGIGLGNSKISLKSLGNSKSIHSTLPRVIVGAQIPLVDNFKLRLSATAERIKSEKIGVPYKVSSSLSYGVGLQYGY